MKNKLLISAPILFAFIFMYSCKDIIEVNLAKKSMSGLAPADSSISAVSSQTFRWDLLEGAIKYQLQIAKPNFTSPLVYLIDTNITKNTFTITLSPGAYQWRVRALNGSSETNYIVRNLTIDSSLNLEKQLVLLTAPTNNIYTNSLTTVFSWQLLTNATSYIFEIDTSNTIVDTRIVTSSSLSYTFTAQGIYSWHVRGQNSTSTSLPSTAHTITVDTTRPLVPVPVSPVYDTIHANPIPLKWNTISSSSLQGTDYCRLQISTDSTFVIVSTKDTVMVAAANPMGYNFYSATIGQKYYWRVSATDKAGNSSGYFTRRRIKPN